MPSCEKTALPRDPLYSRKEAAAYIGVSPKTLAAWDWTRHEPRPRSLHVGRLVKYRKSALDTYLAQREQAAEYVAAG